MSVESYLIENKSYLIVLGNYLMKTGFYLEGLKLPLIPYTDKSNIFEGKVMKNYCRLEFSSKH
jgi:hypothetical protein